MASSKQKQLVPGEAVLSQKECIDMSPHHHQLETVDASPRKYLQPKAGSDGATAVEGSQGEAED